MTNKLIHCKRCSVCGKVIRQYNRSGLCYNHLHEENMRKLKKNRCLNCGKKLIKSRRGMKRKYCSHKCKCNYQYHNSEHRRELVKKNSLKRYFKIKDTRKFKKQRLIYQRIYMEGNREKVNDYMRAYMRKKYGYKPKKVKR